ncbi:MAG: DUF695 domain-containing protein [Clostridium sp.]|nr:DUF695 domain-containing protein [Prevotella sp.]MCM1429581.1 DUF695 domain-containing protein [Clostridium sp.]MCM1476012.1 DUF695 domain-containing protein [Muribaculaceae bacterium]
MSKYGEWWSAPALGDGGNTVIVTGRSDVDKFRNNSKFSIRVEVDWKYSPLPEGMPDRETSELMEQATDLLRDIFAKDPVAVMTGIFTGDGIRTWVFYTLSTHIFGRKFNEALESLPLLPLTISCENDPNWKQYDEMAKLEIFLDD